MKDIVKSVSCCFSGHRPEKLEESVEDVEGKLRDTISKTIEDGYTTFIVGMAKGTDIMAGNIVIEKKKTNDKLRLICASPYEGFEKSWSEDEKQHYHMIIENADDVKFICEHAFRGCFQIRNRYMVDNSSRLIAVYNGTSGGTRNTIKYAEKKDIEIINVLEGGQEI